ncbi:hypothetical protein Q4334_04520 [Acinetobacter baumannii]
MYMIGFCGGGLLHETGTISEVQSFFNTLYKLSEDFPNKVDWSLVLDRLYKRYVRFDDIDKTKEIMDFCKTLLVKDGENEKNNPFMKYFRHFDSCVGDAKAVYTTFGEYIPIKIAVVDLPWQMLEERRPLEEYDQLEGEPFWSREYTKEEIERLSNL